MEEIAYERPEPAPRGQESALEDSPDSASPTQDSHSDVQDGRSRTETSGEPIQNPKSKIQNGKRPYVKTPARLAAARANLEKARAVPKEKVYRRTEKRLAANRANLAKAQAARQQELEEMVDRLDLAFPPLFQEIPAELAGGLMAVLWSSRPLDRAQRLNRQVGRLLQAFVEKRYARAGGVGLTPEAEVLRVLAEDPGGFPPLPPRQKRARRVACARAKPERRRERAPRDPCDRGPDLPENPREFGLWVRRAFCAPHPSRRIRPWPT